MSQSSSQTPSPFVPEIISLLGGLLAAILVALPINTIWSEAPFWVGIVEEPAKVIGVIFLAIVSPQVVSSKMRGMVLGGLGGLGFAFSENFTKFLQSDMTNVDIIWRTIVAVPAHVMWSGVCGFGLVYLAQKRIDLRNLAGSVLSSLRSRDVFSFFLLAIVLHGLFDWSFDVFPYISVGDGSIGSGALLVFFITVFVYYRLWRILPENLQGFKFPGLIGLLGAIARPASFRQMTAFGSLAISKAGQAVATRSGVQSRVTDPLEQKNSYCINCGTLIPIGSGLCPQCGAAQQ